MKYKKSVKLTSLINDEYILLGAEAEGLFRRRERGVWIKRALVIAACLSLLTVGVAAILLPHQMNLIFCWMLLHCTGDTFCEALL